MEPNHTIVSTNKIAMRQEVTNRRNPLALGFCLLAFTFSNASQARETVGTNLQGVVIKEFRCSNSGTFVGNIVNRSKRKVEGTVAIKVFDRDGDPVGRCSSKVSLRLNRETFLLYCNCSYAESVKITIR